MAFDVRDKSLQKTLERHFAKSQRENADALEKLSSGNVFTSLDPRPAERALAEGLEFRMRSLAANKRNMNSAVNLLQTGEAGLAEITDTLLRMKEINVAAANTTLSDKERRFLFIEYEALYDEINRIALTTEYNGIPLLNGNDPATPEALIFRLGDPYQPGNTSGSDADDINKISFDGLKSVVATTEALGIRTAKTILTDSDSEDGISIADVEELLLPEDSTNFPTVYDEALHRLSTQRAIFGALQTRLQRASDYLDVYHENLQAAKSSIADVDYAEQVGRLVESRIRMQAGTAMLAQSQINTQSALTLLQTLV